MTRTKRNQTYQKSLETLTATCIIRNSTRLIQKRRTLSRFEPKVRRIEMEMIMIIDYSNSVKNRDLHRMGTLDSQLKQLLMKRPVS